MASATEPATATWLSLIRDRVVEAEAVIGAAAGAHPVFLDRAQERRRLAGADDARPSVADRGAELGGRARDAAHPADEIERDALGRQHAPRRPFDHRDASARLNRRAVLGESLEADRRVDQAEGERGEIEAGDDALLSGGHHGLRLEVARHDGVGREVSGAAEVLERAPRGRSARRESRAAGQAAWVRLSGCGQAGRRQRPRRKPRRA